MTAIASSQADLEFVRLVPHEFARRHLVLGIPHDAAPGAEQRAMGMLHTSGLRRDVLHNLSVLLKRPLTPQIAEPEPLARLIDDAYGQGRTQPGARVGGTLDIPTISLDIPSDQQRVTEEELSTIAAQSDANLLSLDGKGPVIRLVDSVLFDAIGRSASDIHIQPLADATLIRFRIDGVLATVRSAPPSLAPAIVSRIKIMARMDVAERRAPQDGRATVTIGRGGGMRAIDLRISTLPSTFGERIVIRLLDVRSGLTAARIDALQMPDQVRERYLDRATRSSGIVLVTGPTGSGKTTTLYATLRHIINRSFTGQRSADVNVLTIEDPVEYDLSAAAAGDVGGPMPISQTQVDVKKGVTFAAGLRHILRQDPDVIMVGEIRDAETARIAIQASLTGHLVFSTLHTNDSCGAIARLLDLEAEPFLVASSLSAVLAQRLVRVVHADCAGRGCDACLFSGFRGRRGIFELLVVDAPLRELINARATVGQIMQSGMQRGLTRLEDEGNILVSRGITTAAEVHRVCRGAE